MSRRTRREIAGLSTFIITIPDVLAPGEAHRATGEASFRITGVGRELSACDIGIHADGQLETEMVRMEFHMEARVRGM